MRAIKVPSVWVLPVRMLVATHGQGHGHFDQGVIKVVGGFVCLGTPWLV